MWQRWNGTSKTFEKSSDNGVVWTPLGLSASILTEGLMNLSVTSGIHAFGATTGDNRIAVRSAVGFNFQAVNSGGNGYEFGCTQGSPTDAIFSNNAGTERVRFTDGGSIIAQGAASTFHSVCTDRGVTTAPTGTWVTLFTVPNGLDIAIYLISLGFGTASHDANNYAAYGTVLVEGLSIRIIANNAPLMSIRVTGMNVEGFQQSGVNSTVKWRYIRIA